MLPLPVGREASPGVAAPPYVRHRPERTLLYQLVDEYYPSFKAHLAAQGEALPGYVDQEFEAYLKCGRLVHGFLRVRCDSCHAEHLVAFSCKKRGFCPSCGARRMAESAALLVDEVFPEQPVRQWVLSVPYLLRFLFASRPEVMGRVLGIVYRCIATHLIKKAGFTRKTAQTGAVTLIQRFGSALNLNVHFHMLFLDGVYIERADGRLRFRWVKAPTSAELNQLTQTLARRIGRHLERQGLLERDAENSYLGGIREAAVAHTKLSLTPNGNVRYQLKTPYRDGTTHVIFEPLDFIVRLAALVPKPRVNLTRFHGVFAPNSQYRARVTPAKRGRGGQSVAEATVEEPTAAERRASMTWAQRLKRVFNIDIETCPACGGAVRVIACIEDSDVIGKILAHLAGKAAGPEAAQLPPSRGPPQLGLFG